MRRRSLLEMESLTQRRPNDCVRASRARLVHVKSRNKYVKHFYARALPFSRPHTDIYCGNLPCTTDDTCRPLPRTSASATTRLYNANPWTRGREDSWEDDRERSYLRPGCENSLWSNFLIFQLVRAMILRSQLWSLITSNNHNANYHADKIIALSTKAWI